MNIKETIRAEIERRMDDNLKAEEASKTNIFGVKAVEDNDILSFIDSLPDDPVLSAASDLVSAVERYVQPKPGDEHCLRSELLNTKDKLKALLK